MNRPRIAVIPLVDGKAGVWLMSGGFPHRMNRTKLSEVATWRD